MQLDKITTGVSYGASGVSGGYWMLQLLDTVSPTQWAALGVLSSLVFGLLTFLTNLYFKIREDRRKKKHKTSEQGKMKNNNNKEDVMMSTELKLKLYPSSEKPNRVSKADQYLITNNAAYYNVVVSVLDSHGDFLYFQGWDNGEYETFKPDMYKYWAELPTQLP